MVIRVLCRTHTIRDMLPYAGAIKPYNCRFRDCPGHSLGTRRSATSWHILPAAHDIAYYFDSLNGAAVSHVSIMNARRAISVVLEPTMQYIQEELKKARYIQLDETPFKYRKRKAYVWVIRTNRVCI